MWWLSGHHPSIPRIRISNPAWKTYYSVVIHDISSGPGMVL
jgi:hypothetical protein